MDENMTYNLLGRLGFPILIICVVVLTIVIAASIYLKLKKRPKGF